MIFIDACAQSFEDENRRNTLSDIDGDEIKLLLSEHNYLASYFSCQPGQSSYSCDELQQGVWTYHLSNAMDGGVQEVIVSDEYITDRSLSDYLAKTVATYVKSELGYTQNPKSILDTDSENVIVEIDQNTLKTSEPTEFKIKSSTQFGQGADKLTVPSLVAVKNKGNSNGSQSGQGTRGLKHELNKPISKTEHYKRKRKEKYNKYQKYLSPAKQEFVAVRDESSGNIFCYDCKCNFRTAIPLVQTRDMGIYNCKYCSRLLKLKGM